MQKVYYNLVIHRCLGKSELKYSSLLTRIKRWSVMKSIWFFIGLGLISLSVVPFFLSLALRFRTDTVIDIDFMINAEEIYGPYEEDTYYHTRIAGKSVLFGWITVEGEGIRFTAEGYNTEKLRGIYVNGKFSFTIDPAHDIFTFDNREGTDPSHVNFVLKERWSDIRRLILEFGTTLILFFAGTAIILIKAKDQSPFNFRSP